MKLYFCLLMCHFFCFGSLFAKDDITIEIVDCKEMKLKVRIKNQREDHVEIWKGGNTWGSKIWSFEVGSGGKNYRITRGLIRPGINVPRTYDIPSNGDLILDFALDDGTWEWSEYLKVKPKIDQIRAKLAVQRYDRSTSMPMPAKLIIGEWSSTVFRVK